MKRETRLALIGLVLVLVGGLLAWLIQTEGGRISIRDLRFNGPNGSVMSALLYVPPNATAKTPAPGVLAVHGYINSRETQDGFAIEFARRGYVVLAIDQTGHGYSDPPAFANGFGGPAGLAYLRSLDIVDRNNIGLEGHSMGGWTWLAAAAVMPDAYKASVLEGSSTGAPFAKEGDPSWPRNLAVVFSQHDEFSGLMWSVPRGVDAAKSPKLEKVFGTTDPIVPGKVYGSIADGTARVLYQPGGDHPNDHISTEAIGRAIDWFGQTLQGAKALPSSNQIWMWKEFGTFLGFIGLVLFMLGFGASLLGTKTLAPALRPLPETRGIRGGSWWIGAVITMGVPVLTFYPFFRLGALVTASWFFPETITSQIMVWAVLNGLISLVLFLLWHHILNKKAGGNPRSYGLTEGAGIPWALVGRDFILALATIVVAGYVLHLADYFFKIDFRLWVLALKPLSGLQLGIFLRYLVPFAAFFLMSSVILNGQLRLPQARVSTRYWANIMLLAGGFLVFLAAEYIPLLAGGTLLTATEPLNTIVADQFLPLMVVVALFSTWFYEKTGRVYAGAFVNAMFVTWYIVAGQAIQFPIH
ncbi:MAG TPA: alpha/beta fold hydrolase [Rectinemataceae bacterium]|nr:alpha/beta fold hydrolase [Rectinemataceae bacterium]